MCGINGVTQSNRELVERMNAAIAHRGPDGTDIYTGAGITLGHNRLAIIDTSSRGAQPMKSVDGSLVITYNGELYNYRELKAELTGYPFTSDTDTEVVLAAYAKWGVECLKRFNGIFAFGLWDTRSQELILARDSLGVKPLYYCVSEGKVFFSSEIKALLLAGMARTLDRCAFSHFIRMTDVLGPATLFENIKKMPPGHYAVVKGYEITLQKYGEIEPHAPTYARPEVWHERIRATLDAAVARQLVSDRPVGVFLSGGIDSSAILSSVMHVRQSVRTYTTRFEVESAEEEERFNRDAALARETAAFFGTHHTEITLQRKDVIALFEKSVWHLDEPSGSATALAQMALARVAAKEVAVALGGDGGDELFGGYERYRLSRLMDAYQTLPRAFRSHASPLSSLLKKLNTPQGIERMALFHFTKQPDLNRVIASDMRGDGTTALLKERFFSSPGSFLESLMDADLQLLTDGSLLRTDKLSMASGLEARVPLLDREMVELASRIPGEQKVSLFTTKKLFKDAVRGRLPAYLFQEPKRGWSAPAGAWLERPDFHAYVKEVLSPSYHAPTTPLFDWNGITSVLDEHYMRTRSHRALIWTLLSFQVWARRFQATL